MIGMVRNFPCLLVECCGPSSVPHQLMKYAERREEGGEEGGKDKEEVVGGGRRGGGGGSGGGWKR